MKGVLYAAIVHDRHRVRKHHHPVKEDQSMKRLSLRLLCVLLLVILSGAKDLALAEATTFEIPSVVTGRMGEEVSIPYYRQRKSAEGKLMVLDENGNQLAACIVPSDRQMGSISFAADAFLPLSQTVRIVFRVDGVETVQRECFLALYSEACKTISKIDTQEKKIAITFDTANGEGRTNNLLALLEKYGARCTFFLGGDYATRLPHLAAAITAAGHETASHSMYHIDLRDADDEKIYSHISMSMEVIERSSGQPVTLFRPPSGFSTYRDQAIAHALGCESVFWTFDSMDGFRDQTEDQILRRMLKESEPGAIILMHIYGQYTLQVLDKYLPELQAEGYEFVTVTELLQCGPKI